MEQQHLLSSAFLIGNRITVQTEAAIPSFTSTERAGANAILIGRAAAAAELKLATASCSFDMHVDRPFALVGIAWAQVVAEKLPS